MTNSTRDARRGRIMLSALVAGMLAATLVSGSVAAGKPSAGGATSGSLAWNMVVDSNGNAQPNWNDQVTFTLNTSETKPWVRLDCYQGGAWVSTTSHGFFSDYPWPPDFTLASGGWMSGAADCTATLYKVTSNGRTRNLASLTFHVDP